VRVVYDASHQFWGRLQDVHSGQVDVSRRLCSRTAWFSHIPATADSDNSWPCLKWHGLARLFCGGQWTRGLRRGCFNSKQRSFNFFFISITSHTRVITRYNAPVAQITRKYLRSGTRTAITSRIPPSIEDTATIMDLI
jgi:hypothetical protein